MCVFWLGAVEPLKKVSSVIIFLLTTIVLGYIKDVNISLLDSITGMSRDADTFESSVVSVTDTKAVTVKLVLSIYAVGGIVTLFCPIPPRPTASVITF